MSAEHPSDELQAQFDFVKWGAQLRAELSSSIAGVWLRGAEARPVGTGVPTGSPRVSNSAGRLVGWSLSQDSAAAGVALVELYDGQDTTGTLVASVTLAVGQSVAFSHHGIGFVYGLFASITGAGAATVRGAVYLGKTE